MSAAERLGRSIAADRRARGLANADTLDEATFQSQVVELASMTGWSHLHVRRTRGRGGAWTTSTNLPGWPDLLLWHPVGQKVLAVELKSQRGVVRPEQTEVHESLLAAGVDVRVWRPSDWDEIQQTLTAKGRRTLTVQWHPDAVQRAHDTLVEFRDGRQPAGIVCTQSIEVAIDALRAAGANPEGGPS